MDDLEKGPCHGAKSQYALSKVADPLLDDVIHRPNYFVFVGFVGVSNLACDAEGVGVKWRLGNQAIGKRNPKQARDERGQAKEKDVPVKARWFTKRELCPLRYQGRDCLKSAA